MGWSTFVRGGAWEEVHRPSPGAGLANHAITSVWFERFMPCVDPTAGSTRALLNAGPRQEHLARVRSRLESEFKETLSMLESFTPLARDLTLAKLKPYRLDRAPPDAKALAAQWLAWHPEVGYGEAREGQRLKFTRGRFEALGLTRHGRHEDLPALLRRCPLEMDHPCDRCGAAGRLWVGAPTLVGGSGFACGSCRHAVGLDRNGNDVWCTCGPCRSERDGVRQRFQRELWPPAKEAVERSLAQQLRDALIIKGPLQPPSELQMTRDWTMNRSSLSRVEAEVIALRPRTPAELFDLFDQLELARHRQGRRRTVTRETLCDRLLEHRVLYLVHAITSTPAGSASLLLAHLVESLDNSCWFMGSPGRADIVPDRWVVARDVLRILEEGDDAEFWLAFDGYWKFRGTTPRATKEAAGPLAEPHRAATGLRQTSPLVQWALDLRCLTDPRLSHRTPLAGLVDASLQLNPAAASISVAEDLRMPETRVIIPAARRRVIGQGPEEAELARLKAGYPDHLIAPQLPLIAAIDFDKLATHLPREALKYLRWCRVDFGIIDPDSGEVARVVEVQAGSHHDAPDQEQKDLWKRQACALAGIPLEEVL